MDAKGPRGSGKTYLDSVFDLKYLYNTSTMPY